MKYFKGLQIGVGWICHVIVGICLGINIRVEVKISNPHSGPLPSQTEIYGTHPCPQTWVL
jgi:hypothetical protein